MLTPIEIQSKSFKSGGLGYDKREVDQFMREILLNYETLYRENMELKDKVTTLTQGIQYYKTIERTLQKALVLAEKTAEDTKAAASRNAKTIEKEALTKSQLIVADAKYELEHIHSQTIQIVQQYEKYKAQFKSLAAAQIELLESDSFAINVSRIDTFSEPEKEKNAVSDSILEMSSFEEAYEKAATASEEIDGLEEASEAISDIEPEGFEFIDLEDLTND